MIFFITKHVGYMEIMESQLFTLDIFSSSKEAEFKQIALLVLHPPPQGGIIRGKVGIIFQRSFGKATGNLEGKSRTLTHLLKDTANHARHDKKLFENHCQRKKIPVTGRKFLSQEENSWYRKKIPVTGRYLDKYINYTFVNLIKEG